MRINIENIAQVRKAEIDLLGITSLIGYNSTGKSTISKSLAAIGEAFSNFDKKVDEVRVLEMSREIVKWEEKNRNLLRQVRKKAGKDFSVAYKKYDALFSTFSRTINRSIDEIRDLIEFTDHYLFIDIMKKKYQLDEWEYILHEVQIYNDNDSISLDIQLEELYKRVEKFNYQNVEKYERNVIERAFATYFKSQISSFYNQKEGKVELIDDSGISSNKVIFEDNRLKKFDNAIAEEIPIIYIQPCNILDSNIRFWFSSALGTRVHTLEDRLEVDFPNESTPIEVESRDKIINIVESVLEDEKNIGVLARDDWSLVYKDSKSNQEISMCNVASGIKNIVIIKRLAVNGQLKENSVLIIDEPEVNLHPEWQLKFAELLVRLYCEANIKIFINTHSPYFLRAIEYYSDLCGVLDKNKFYYMKNIDGMQSDAMDKTNALDEIYDDMATVLDKLMKEE
ncbi:AAA family ATPase [Acetoanaerobium noterae]|uniref:AAA family ATPase n=1 Tax=Acetoanaerobium noterae TaxID=745369 RepID=UPI0033424348